MVSNALLTIDSKIERVERCLCSFAVYFIKSRVCGSGVCDGQRSSLIQLQSVSESPISIIIIKTAVIVLSVDLSDEKAVVSKFPHSAHLSVHQYH